MKAFLFQALLLFFAIHFLIPALAQQGNYAAFKDPQNRSLKEVLAAYEISNDHEIAVTELNKILERQKLSQQDQLDVQITLIHKLQEQKKWDTCLQYCQQQVTKARQQQNAYLEASFYKLIGNTYYNIPDKKRAMEYWNKCITISATNQYNLLLEQSYHNVGVVLLEDGANFAEAEKNFQKAIDLSIQNKTDTTQLGNLHYRLLATLYEESGRVAKAADLYKTVIKRARELNDSLRIAEALMFYSRVLSKEHKNEEAIATGKEALDISRKFNKLDMEQTALGQLAYVYAYSGNYKNAYQLAVDQNNLYVKRYETDLNNKIGVTEARFKNAEIKYEKELEIIKAKKEKQIYLLSGVGLLAISAFGFHYFYQKRNLQQKLILQKRIQEEKERLSLDLHDNLGSQMALLSNTIETLDTNYKNKNAIGENLERVKGTSKQLLQTLRETIWILNKEQVSALDFFDKLVDYTHRYLKTYKDIQLTIEENFTDTKMLHSNEALQLFRICQEGIANSCKYAETGQILLFGQLRSDVLEIKIQDYGKGFNLKTLQAKDHYGLENMQKRAKEINAIFEIETAEEKGVLISIKL